MAVVRCQLSILFLAFTVANCADYTKDSVSIDTGCSEDLSVKEIYDNIDNNCNGFIDEGFICRPGNRQQCWPADAGSDVYQFLKNPELALNSVLNGECKQGEQFCSELEAGGSNWGIFEDGYDGIGGTQDDIWKAGGCIGAVLPATEQCNRLDDNCDGRTDEGLKRSCWSGPANLDTHQPADYLVFYDATNNPDGICKLGTELCENGIWSGCLYEVLPSDEMCDSVDNDCDGQTDEHTKDTQTSCGLTDTGACQFGQLVCQSSDQSSGADVICQNAVLPENEVCDGVDNDCDGQTDEELYRHCETICDVGVESCYAGEWRDCSAAQPEAEQCNGLDDNCNGLVDEELQCTCPPDLIGLLIPCKIPDLVCGLGFFTCDCADEECSTTIQTECKAVCAYQELPEEQLSCDETIGLVEAEQCNNWDDDCDGKIDEDLTRECYSGPLGTLNVGLCSGDTQVCDSGRWGGFDNENHFVADTCLNQTFPELEICDEQDNDCDGEIDENLNRHDKVDMVFIIDRSGSMCNKIQALQDGIRPYVASFVNTEHRFAIVNVPSRNFQVIENNVLIDFTDVITFLGTLDNVDCSYGAVEPQYDAVFDIAMRNLQISFRADAWPMLIVITDELAQSVNGRNPQSIRLAISPCTIGLCTPNDKLEIYALVSNQFFVEWCLPADIAKTCYDLPENVTSQQITEYLNEIFSDVCR